MEFANGQTKGSIYSIGYLVTDEHFHILIPPTDLLISPECEWNAYVKENILAYPIDEVEAAPTFPECYDKIAALFSSVDLAVGFSVGNDVRALRADCLRYEKPVITYRWFDLERLCKRMEEHKEAHGLDGYFAAWCGGTPDHRHRSDGDARATARILEEICRWKRVDASMLIAAYPECTGLASETEPKKKPQNGGKGRKRFFRRHPKKKGGSKKEKLEKQEIKESQS
jgi:DNA polymerase III epsilon subunit-like protein